MIRVLMTLLLIVPVGGLAAELPQDVPTIPRGSLPLADLARRALAVNPTVAAARAAIAEAEGALRSARAPMLPDLALQATGVRFEEPMPASPIHGLDPSSVPDFDRTLMQLGLGASYTVFDGGRTRAGIEGASALAGAREADLGEVASRLILSVVEAFSAGASASIAISAHDRYVAALEAERDRAAQRVAAGADPPLATMRAEAALARALADREVAVGRLALARAALARLLDQSVEEVTALEFYPVVVEGSPPVDPPSNPPPSILSAMEATRAAEAELTGVQSAWLPTVDLTGGWNLFAGANANGVAEWQAGVRISYPLFTGGSRAGAVDAALARTDAAQARLDAIDDALGQEVDEARIAEAEAHARVAALLTALDAYDELVRVERLAVDEGAGVQADLLRAEADRYEIDLALVEARRAALLARVRWARATGRLTPEWLETLTSEGS